MRGGGRQRKSRWSEGTGRENETDKSEVRQEEELKLKIVLVSECGGAWRMNTLIFIFTPCSALQGWTHCSRPISVAAQQRGNPVVWCHLPPNDTYDVVTVYRASL